MEEAGLRSKITKGCRSAPPFAGSLTAMMALLRCSAMSAKIAIWSAKLHLYARLVSFQAWLVRIHGMGPHLLGSL